MNTRVSLTFVFCLELIATTPTRAASYGLSDEPKLQQKMEWIFGEFDYDTATSADCHLPLLKFQMELLKGTFDESAQYLAQAYVHQGHPISRLAGFTDIRTGCHGSLGVFAFQLREGTGS